MILYDKDELMRLTKQDLLDICQTLKIEVDEKMSKEKLSTMIAELKKTDTDTDVDDIQEPAKPSVIKMELSRRSNTASNAFKNELNKRLGRRTGRLSFQEQVAERTKRYRR